MSDFKKIEGYENYEVSKYGKVFNTVTKKYVNGSKDNHGYILVTLSNKNKPKTLVLHRLVARSFLENPNNKKIVKHRDGDNMNNAVSNLYWSSCHQVQEQSRGIVISKNVLLDFN